MSERESPGEDTRGAATGGGEAFLDRLVARSERRLPLLSRRRPGLFEPRGPAQDTEDTLPDETEAPRPVAGAPVVAERLAQPAAAPAPPIAPTLARPRLADAPTPRRDTALRIEAAASPAEAPADARAGTGRARAADSPALSPPPSLRMPPRTDDGPARAAAANVVPPTAPQTPVARAAADAPASAALAPPTRIESLRSETTTRVIEHRVERLRETVIAAESGAHDDAPTPMPSLRSPERLPPTARDRPTRVADPARTAALAAPPPAPAPPPVQVSIGRVEIRARTGAPAAPAAAPSRRPRLALEDYLQQRHPGPRHGDGR